MGYYSDFQVETEPPTAGIFLLRYGEDYFTNKEGKFKYEQVKWYDFVSDFTRASLENPNVLFKVHRVGEGNYDWDGTYYGEDDYIYFFLNGKHYKQETNVFSSVEFDVSKLEV